MIYILFVWTVVAQSGQGIGITTTSAWRPIGEFHDHPTAAGSAADKCNEAAKQLGFQQYKCIRSK